MERILQVQSNALAKSVERLTAMREVKGSIPEAGPILGVLKKRRNDGIVLALQTARPSHGSDDHIKKISGSVGDKNSVFN